MPDLCSILTVSILARLRYSHTVKNASSVTLNDQGFDNPHTNFQTGQSCKRSFILRLENPPAWANHNICSNAQPFG